MAPSAQKVVILGATSAIAEAAARHWASDGAIIHLAARKAAQTADIAADLRIRGARAASFQVADLGNDTLQRDVVDTALRALGGPPDIVLVAWGTLPDQEMLLQDPVAAGEALRINFVSAAQYVLRFGEVMRRQRHGVILVIGSVAGDIGRAKNFVYGAAKGGLEVFCEGARRRFRADGVRVIVVKPGLVDTPMTAHLSKHAMFASAPRVGRCVYEASWKANGPVYAPAWWRLVMTLLRAMPRRVLDRVNI
jgi:decaprenylphospho-beta-D-erythro-pentofuranosid-2-ulose 2-reductase